MGWWGHAERKELGPVSVLGRFGLRSRILHEKLYRVTGSDNSVLLHFLKIRFFIGSVLAYKRILGSLNQPLDPLEL